MMSIFAEGNFGGTCHERAVAYCRKMDLAENWKAVNGCIESACQRAGREPGSVTLLGVTKGQPPEKIEALVQLGLTLFGENRIQEARAKIGRCSAKARWHMIGHLQSNKCRDAVQWFSMIQSVDSLALAQEIDKWANKSAKTMPILLEVNVAGESTKFGFQPAEVREQLLEINRLPRVEVHGLMTIAPWARDPEKVRPIFRALRELKIECEQALGTPLPHLSMGMSGDFEVAIEEGATLIRIGTALFGPRQTVTRREFHD